MKWGLQCNETPRSHIVSVTTHDLTATAPITLKFTNSELIPLTLVLVESPRA